MTIQVHVVETAKEAAAEFFRYAKSMPADRVEWKAEGVGQSVLSMAREIAMTPVWAIQAMTGVESSEEDQAAMMEKMGSLSSVEQCEEEFSKNVVAWAEFVTALPDSKLSDTRWLPYNGGRDHTMLEMLEYPRWNATYHTGQVAFIQTLYGDKNMY